MLNPFIYSLRNRNMKEALSNLMNRIASLLWCHLLWYSRISQSDRIAWEPY
jgi:hypothetical protein